MITPATYQRVAEIIADIANAEILTRFQTLTDADITEKSPGDLVTTADTITEQALTEHLEKLLPGSVTVGEEATENDQAILDHLHTDTPTWIIDPVDGTSNFVRGRRDYACLVALAQAGTVHASWLYAPSLDLTAGAHDGHGVWINHQPAVLRTPPAGDPLNIVTTHTNYLDGYNHLITKLDRPGQQLTACRSAGLSYIDLINGDYDALVYTWEKPWDHATGLHIHTSLGGTNSTMDEKSFAITGGNTLPFVVAAPDTINTITSQLRS